MAASRLAGTRATAIEAHCESHRERMGTHGCNRFGWASPAIQSSRARSATIHVPRMRSRTPSLLVLHVVPHEYRQACVKILEARDKVDRTHVPPLVARHLEIVGRVEADRQLIRPRVEGAPKLLVGAIVAEADAFARAALADVHALQVRQRALVLGARRPQHEEASRNRAALAKFEHERSGRVPHERGRLGGGELVEIAQDGHVVVHHDHLVELRERQRREPLEGELVERRRPRGRGHQVRLEDMCAERDEAGLRGDVTIAGDDDVDRQRHILAPRGVQEPRDAAQLAPVRVPRLRRILVPHVGRAECEIQ
mmetsp:Transcript_47635/g.132340  ORF Transcript_47635/g.132340 Transcript_47635/m.132340 type:complete len:311 (-) Transcript_47635:227-1159(-)